MGKRKRIMSIIRTTKRIKAIELLAEQFEVGYQCAFEAYLIAKKYCEVFKDKTILQETEYLLLLRKTNKIEIVS